MHLARLSARRGAARRGALLTAVQIFRGTNCAARAIPKRGG